jgi:hypothetical protein
MDQHPQYWIRVAAGRPGNCSDQDVALRLDGDELSLVDASQLATIRGDSSDFMALELCCVSTIVLRLV